MPPFSGYRPIPSTTPLPPPGTPENDLLTAIRNRDSDALIWALNAGADPNTRIEYNQTALHRAALYGPRENVRRLLESGADVATVDPWGMSALYPAVQGQDTAIVKALLDAGIDVNGGVTHSITPLMWAAAHGSADMVRTRLGGHGTHTARGRRRCHHLGIRIYCANDALLGAE